MDTYIPINCHFHDRLEDAIVRGQDVDLVYLVDGVETSHRTRILDIKTQLREEFMVIAGTEEWIRLDRLVSLNGNPLEDPELALCYR